jgi:hypothetical protein
MESLRATRAWAVSYTPQYFLEMGEEYDGERLAQLNEYLAKGDYVPVSDDTQGFPGNLVIDFPANSPEPYRASKLLGDSK